jgi:hypothetical protein
MYCLAQGAQTQNINSSQDDPGMRGESHKIQVTRMKAKTKIGNELLEVVLHHF